MLMLVWFTPYWVGVISHISYPLCPAVYFTILLLNLNNLVNLVKLFCVANITHLFELACTKLAKYQER